MLVAVDVHLHSKYQTSAGFNVWGYRGPVVGGKRPGEYRVVFLGGSSAFGYGVGWSDAIPAQLELALRRRLSRPLTVINLGYNNEGAYSMRFTLDDYRYLDYDLACLYEGYNDMMGDPRRPNTSVFRHDSPVFRLTGYLPIFPIIFKEKASAILHPGDLGIMYQEAREGRKTVFNAGIARRTAAGILDATAAVEQSLEQQLDRMTKEPPPQVVGASATGCRYPWQEYCASMQHAIDYALGFDRQVLVITQPYEVGPKLGARHRDQQHELVSMIERKYGGDRRVEYANVGDSVDLADPSLSFDSMHLTAEGNRRVAAALVASVVEMAGRRPAR